MSVLTFDVSGLMEQATGSSEAYSFAGPVKFDDLKLTKDLCGTAEIMRIEDGFNAVIKEVEGQLSFQCERCLEEFKQDFHLDPAERQYYFHRPRKVEDEYDLFLVDTKHQKIDLAEMLRQEIILHFPIIQVCSTSCQGICAHCGKNRNSKKCNCKDEEPDKNEHKPLSALKDLIK